MCCYLYFFCSLIVKSILFLCPELTLDGTDNLDINDMAAHGPGGALCWESTFLPCVSIYFHGPGGREPPWAGRQGREGEYQQQPFFFAWDNGDLIFLLQP